MFVRTFGKPYNMLSWMVKQRVVSGDGQVVRRRCGVVRWRGLVGGGGKLRRLAAVRSGCIHTSKREEKKRYKEGVGAEVERKRWKEATGTRGVVLCCHLLSRIERTRSPHHPGDFHKADQPTAPPSAPSTPSRFRPIFSPMYATSFHSLPLRAVVFQRG
jgi:hypothetical protein